MTGNINLNRRSRFDTGEDDHKPPTGELLDHTPLTFGKYGPSCEGGARTPDWVAQHNPRYLIWMYENITGRPTCSRLLYEATMRDMQDEDDPEYPDGSPMFGPGDRR